jgi:uncharacterized protein DUF4154
VREGARTGRPTLRRVAAAAIALAGAVLAPGAAQAGAPPPEDQVKAVFLFNFTKFIEWPTKALGRPERPFSICLLGQDRLGDDLDELARSSTVQGRRIAVRRLARGDDVTRCHILFISASEHDHLATVLDKVADWPIFTVGEVEDFTRQGGSLRFFLLEGTVRFEINLKATARAGLKVNARLLKIAQVTTR